MSASRTGSAILQALVLLIGSLALVGWLSGCESPSYEGDDYSIGLPARGASSDDESKVDASVPRATTPARHDAGTSDATTQPPTGQVDAATNTTPVTQTFTLGPSDCNGSHCSGGYDDVKEQGQLTTASKQCVDRGFARATDFTIGGQPGGQFCSFNGTVYGCDPSCSGCNLMTTVTCVKP